MPLSLPPVALHDEYPKMPGTFQTSISAVDTFRSCRLKWYYNKILKWDAPQHASAALGTEVHDLAEQYLRHGKLPHDGRAGRILQAGLHHLPAPGTHEVERWFSMPVMPAAPDGAPAIGIVGKVDFFRLDRPPFVGDHKTTGDFKWAKTVDELGRDPQMLTYARAVGLLAAARDGKGAPARIDLCHVQYRTKGAPLAQRIDTTVPWSAVEKNWAEVQRTTIAMRALAAVPDVPTVIEDSRNASPAACSSYGGCPFADRCKFGPEGRQAAMVERNTRALVAGPASTNSTTEGTNTMTPAERRKLLFGGAPATAPAAATPVAPPAPPAPPPAVINPPDAAPQSHQTPALHRATADALVASLKVIKSASSAFFDRLLVKNGVAPEHKETILALAGAILQPDGWVVLAPEGAVAPAPPPPPAPAVDPVTGTDDEYDIVEVRPGDCRAYSVATGEAIRVNGAFRWPSKADALAAVRSLSAPAPVAPTRIPAAEIVANLPPLNPQPLGAPHTVTPAPAPVTAAATTPCPDDVDPAAWAAIDADIQRALVALEDGMTRAAADAAIKGALGMTRLSTKARNEVLDAGVALGMFIVLEDGSITFDDVVVDPPTAAVVPTTPAPATPATTTAEETVVVVAPPPTAAQVVAPPPDADAARPVPVTVVVPTPAPVVVGGAPAAGTPPTAPNNTPMAPMVIFVDCYPTEGTVEALDNILDELCDEVAVASNVAHYGLVDFGKGAKYVASRLMVRLSKRGLPPGWWSYSSTSPLAADVLPLFRRAGALIVRGVR